MSACSAYAAWPVYEMMRDEFGLKLPFDDWISAEIRCLLPLGCADGLKPRQGALEIFQRLAAREASFRRWCRTRTG